MINIRNFNGEDVRIVSMLFINNIEEIMEVINAPLEDMTTKERHAAMGMKLLPLFGKIGGSVIWERLASIAEMTVERIDKMPATTWLDIIEAIIDRGDYKDFFTRCAKLAGLTSPTALPDDTAGQ